MTATAVSGELDGHRFCAREPIVFRGLSKDWPAVAKWTPDYLRKMTAVLGEIEVGYRSTPPEMERVDLSKLQRGKVPLRQLLDECHRSPEEGEEIYISGLDLPASSALASDIGAIPFLPPSKIRGTSIFLGRNTRCIGHYHPKAQALLCQVQGTKRIRLYAPSELEHLYLFPFWSRGFFRSQVNFYGDTRRFPRVLKATSVDIELAPGDALFIPMHWLHVPEGKGWSLSATFWWRPRLGDWNVNAASARALIGVGFEAVRRYVIPRSWVPPQETY